MSAKSTKSPAPDYGEYVAHPAADVFPLIREEGLQRLADDIKEHGQLDPIEILEDTNQIVDGRNRFLACGLAGVEPRITRISMMNMPYGVYEYVVSKNLLRRQLTSGQRQAVVKKLREGGHSIRAIADLTGIPVSTVGRDVKDMSQSGQLDQPERIEGKDGRSRAASVPQNGDGETGKAESETEDCPVVLWPKAFRQLRALLTNYAREVPSEEADKLAAILRAAIKKLNGKTKESS